jgi:pSer/pThr/pTyr-binding forkhead associated (FHA) protein
LHVLNPGGDQRVRQGSSLPLKSTTRLGAGVENDIILSDPYISDRHARMTWDGSAWWIEDLGSKNGSRVDGAPCPPHVPCQVASGARLALGEMVFELLV